MKLFKERINKFKRIHPLVFNILWKGSALLIGLVLFFGLWSIISRAISSTILPEPITTLKTIFKLLGKSATYKVLGYTIGRIALALFTATIIGVFLGSLAGYYQFVEYVLKPIVIVLRSFPSVALMLILIIFTKNASFYLVCIVLFPIIYESTLRGVGEIKSEYQSILKLDGQDSIVNIPKVALPLSTDYILIGIFQSLGLGLKVQIMGESLMGSTTFVGLGIEIYKAYLNLDMDVVFAYSILAITLIMIADLLTLVLKRKLKQRLLEQGKAKA